MVGQHFQGMIRVTRFQVLPGNVKMVAGPEALFSGTQGSALGGTKFPVESGEYLVA